MAAGISQRGKSLCPCIRITVMGSARRVLSPAMSAAALLGLCGGAVLLGCLGIARISEPRQVAREERAAMRAERVNADLQDAIARLQDKLARAEGERSEAENRLSALAGQAAALRDQLATAKAKLAAAQALANPSRPAPSGQPAPNPDRIARLQQTLARLRHGVHVLEAESATLAARVNKTEADRAEQDALYRRYQASLAESRRAAQRLGLSVPGR
jgi:uncharacterized protein YlxW (UPF0749 family)